MGSGGPSLEEKRPRFKTDRSPSSYVEVKSAWGCASTPPYTFINLCSIITGTALSVAAK